MFPLILRSTNDKTLHEMGKFAGTVLHTSQRKADEERLPAALDEAHRKESSTRTAKPAPDRTGPRLVVRVA